MRKTPRNTTTNALPRLPTAPSLRRTSTTPTGIGTFRAIGFHVYQQAVDDVPEFFPGEVFFPDDGVRRLSTLIFIHVFPGAELEFLSGGTLYDLSPEREREVIKGLYPGGTGMEHVPPQPKGRLLWKQ